MSGAGTGYGSSKRRTNNSWPGGQSQWMTIDEFKKQPKYFQSVLEAIEMLDKGETYISKIARYNENDY